MTTAQTKRKAFAEAVFRGYSNAEAARRAGYSPHTSKAAASRLIKHPEVAAELARLKAQAKTTGNQVQPLEHLLAVVNDTDADPRLRVRAAIAAARYVHPAKGEGGKRDEAADKAKRAAAGRYAPKAPPLKLVQKGGD